MRDLTLADALWEREADVRFIGRELPELACNRAKTGILAALYRLTDFKDFAKAVVMASSLRPSPPTLSPASGRGE